MTVKTISRTAFKFSELTIGDWYLDEYENLNLKISNTDCCYYECLGNGNYSDVMQTMKEHEERHCSRVEIDEITLKR